MYLIFIGRFELLLCYFRIKRTLLIHEEFKKGLPVFYYFNNNYIIFFLN
jgi:hypothetical protein